MSVCDGICVDVFDVYWLILLVLDKEWGVYFLKYDALVKVVVSAFDMFWVSEDVKKLEDWKWKGGGNFL